MRENNSAPKFHISFNISGKLIVFHRPLIMGILNITPDSFYEGSRTQTLEVLVNKASFMIQQGADILDVGGQSTRPGAELISQDEELSRVLPAIQALKQNFPNTLISIDTFYASVAQSAIEQGAHIVNDISAGDDDPNMIEAVAKLKVPYIFMHKKGRPPTMQNQAEYRDVVMEVTNYLAQKASLLKQYGIQDCIADPGFGFGKTLEQNYQLFNAIPFIAKVSKCPILVGISRKSMLWKPLNLAPDTSLNATSALNLLAMQKGASIIRVHDVKEASEVRDLHGLLAGGG